MKKIILFAFLFSSFAQAQMPEAIYGFGSARPGIFIQVFSGGCTKKEDFQIRRKSKGPVSELTFLRIVPDTCLANFPYGEMIYFPWEDLGLEEGDLFRIGNPVGVSQRKNF